MQGAPTIPLLYDVARLALGSHSIRPSRVRFPEAPTDPMYQGSRFPDTEHLEAAAQWIGAAQDANTDGGIAGRYSFRTGWSASYPETTGYLVPTLLRLAGEADLASSIGRAERAVTFLLGCQLADGSFFGGLADGRSRQSSVFNTGQIICGLIAWHRHSNDARAIDAAARAANWLVSTQDASGAWTRHVYHDLATTYSAYASCWLAELGEYIGDQRYRESARRHVDWVLSCVDAETGWVDLAGFTAQQHADRIAYTHTIAYTLAGVLMTSRLVGAEPGIAAVQRAAHQVAVRMESHHWLPGILDAQWAARANYACVTGTAQMAIIWMELFERDGNADWIRAAMAAIEMVKQAQLLRARTPGLVGGVPGSDPVWGRYLRFACPNWAAKYAVDALLDKRRIVASTR